MKKFNQFKKLVNEKGNSKMQEIIIPAQKICFLLNRIFKKHESMGKEVTTLSLVLINQNNIIKILLKNNLIPEEKSSYFSFRVDEAFLIVQHTWTFKDHNGKLLNKLKPHMFPDGTILDVDTLFKRLHDLNPMRSIDLAYNL